MDHKQLRKLHPDLFKLWVRHKFKYGDNPIPQPEKNYVIAIVSDSNRCFVLLEYSDGWIAENGDDRVQDINIPSKEIISFTEKEISENNFIEFLNREVDFATPLIVLLQQVTSFRNLLFDEW